ncbi:2189_t:CDS:2, partial [Gigaspora margarita]
LNYLFQKHNDAINLREKDKCPECDKHRYFDTTYCEPCNSKRFSNNFSKWASGLPEIDKLIEESQLNARTPSELVEWIPYYEIDIKEHIADGEKEFAIKSNNTIFYGTRFLRAIREFTASLKLQLQSPSFMNNIYGITYDPQQEKYCTVVDFQCDEHPQHPQIPNYVPDPYIALIRNSDPQERPIATDMRNNFNVASDIYSLGVIFWLIPSGKEPFEDEVRDELLFRKIAKGLREEPFENTPIRYIFLFQDCWHLDPEVRPNISQVINTLKGIEESGKFCSFTVNRAHVDLGKYFGNCKGPGYEKIYLLKDLGHISP